MWRRVITIVCAVVLFTACNKDESTEPTQTQTPKRLASLTDISYTQSRNYDQTTGEEIVYATSGSRSTTTMKWSSNGLPVSFGMSEIGTDLITIEYNGNKISHITLNAEAVTSPENNMDISCTYTGDLLTEVYMTSSNGWTKKTLSYNNNGDLVSVMMEASEGNITTVTLEWENGNVTRETETTVQNTYTRTTVYEYLYDNKYSYYTGIGPLAMVMSVEGYYILSRNNVLRMSRTTNDGHTSTEVYRYTYDGDWPITVSSPTNDNSSYLRQSTTYLRYTDGSGATAPQTYTIRVNSNLTNNNNVYVMGGGEYEAGRQVVLRAQCYLADTTFMCWNDGVTDNPRTITATEDAEYIAVFGAPDKK